MTIWKFTIHITDRQRVTMPEGAKLLSAQRQNGALCLWAIVDPNAAKVDRAIVIVGTGHPFDSAGTFVDTFQIPEAGLVFHVFDEGEDSY